jgi:hypothetical protein
VDGKLENAVDPQVIYVQIIHLSGFDLVLIGFRFSESVVSVLCFSMGG